MVAIVAGAVVGGIVVGMLGAFVLVRAIRRQLDPLIIVRENAALREKVNKRSSATPRKQPRDVPHSAAASQPRSLCACASSSYGSVGCSRLFTRTSFLRFHVRMTPPITSLQCN